MVCCIGLFIMTPPLRACSEVASSFSKILCGAVPNIQTPRSWIREAGSILCTKLGAPHLAIRGPAKRGAAHFTTKCHRQVTKRSGTRPFFLSPISVSPPPIPFTASPLSKYNRAATPAAGDRPSSVDGDRPTPLLLPDPDRSTSTVCHVHHGHDHLI